MKKIGILFGQESSFPNALIERINSKNVPGVSAEAVLMYHVEQGKATDYAVIIDRISQDVPFYRAFLKNAALQGTQIINNPFWWSADEKFFNNCLAIRLGVPVPKTVLLPSNQLPPDTTEDSFRNLGYPLNWDAITEHIGFPAYMKPHSGGGWKHVYKVNNLNELFDRHREAGSLVMLLQEEIVFEEYYRCYCIGRKYVLVMPYEPRNPHELRYTTQFKPSEKMVRLLTDYVLKLNNGLGYDFNTVEFAVRDGIPYAIDFCNPAPDADVHSVGSSNFEWVVEHAARYAIECALEHRSGRNNITWGNFVIQSTEQFLENNGMAKKSTTGNNKPSANSTNNTSQSSRKLKKTPTENTEENKKRGRKPKVKSEAESMAVATEPKKRGRKPKVKSEAESMAVATEPKKRGRKPKVKSEAELAAVATEPKKRGRKPKVKSEAESTAVATEPKKRGRKPKVKSEAESTAVATEPKKRGRKPKVKSEAESTAVATEPKKRGRKPKVKSEAESTAVATEPKKRGRKPKVKSEAESTAAAAAPKKSGRKPKVKSEAESTAVAAEPKKSGRKPKVKSEAESTAVAAEPKKSGRKPKVKSEAESTAAAAEPKKSGRKPKGKSEAESTAAAAEPKKSGRKPKGKSEAESTAAAAEPKKSGRKPIGKSEAESTAAAAEPKKSGRKPKVRTVNEKTDFVAAALPSEKKRSVPKTAEASVAKSKANTKADKTPKVDVVKKSKVTPRATNQMPEESVPSVDRKPRRVQKMNLTHPQPTSKKGTKSTSRKEKGGKRVRLERPPISEFGLDAVNYSEQMKNPDF